MFNRQILFFDWEKLNAHTERTDDLVDCKCLIGKFTNLRKKSFSLRT